MNVCLVAVTVVLSDSLFFGAVHYYYYYYDY